MDKSVLNIVAGTLNLSLGLVYMIMSFIIPSFPPPNPISINWQNWKDFSAEGLDLARPKHLSVEVNKKKERKEWGGGRSLSLFHIITKIN